MVIDMVEWLRRSEMTSGRTPAARAREAHVWGRSCRPRRSDRPLWRASTLSRRVQLSGWIGQLPSERSVLMAAHAADLASAVNRVFHSPPGSTPGQNPVGPGQSRARGGIRTRTEVTLPRGLSRSLLVRPVLCGAKKCHLTWANAPARFGP